MIWIMTQKVLHNWGNIFWMVIFFDMYCQEAYLEPNQKFMVEFVSKNS